MGLPPHLGKVVTQFELMLLKPEVVEKCLRETFPTCVILLSHFFTEFHECFHCSKVLVNPVSADKQILLCCKEELLVVRHVHIVYLYDSGPVWIRENQKKFKLVHLISFLLLFLLNH